MYTLYTFYPDAEQELDPDTYEEYSDACYFFKRVKELMRDNPGEIAHVMLTDPAGKTIMYA